MISQNVEVGQLVKEQITTGANPCFVWAVGEVIWIHPENRFYRVRFDSLSGSCVESYPMVKISGNIRYTPEQAEHHKMYQREWRRRKADEKAARALK